MTNFEKLKTFSTVQMARFIEMLQSCIMTIPPYETHLSYMGTEDVHCIEKWLESSSNAPTGLDNYYPATIVIGTPVYSISPEDEIEEVQLSEIRMTTRGDFRFTLEGIDTIISSDNEELAREFGKTIFLTKEEAMEHLKQGIGESDI